MGKYNTKYFGEIAIDEASDFESIDIQYENKEINISLSDCNIYGNNIKICLNIIDKYIEINETAKKEILKNFPKNETVKHYFECHFDILAKEQIIEIFGVKTFDKIDINKTVKELGYPDLLFGIHNNEINFSVYYKISEAYCDETLCVRMNKKLEIINFLHES